MRSIAVMDIFCSFGVCIEGDPRQGRHFPLNIQFLLACVVFLAPVCVNIVERVASARPELLPASFFRLMRM